VHAFSEKNDHRSEHLQTLDYHPGKFHVDPFSSFSDIPGQKSTGEEKEYLEM
jgi:hypothetical protein